MRYRQSVTPSIGKTSNRDRSWASDGIKKKSSITFVERPTGGDGRDKGVKTSEKCVQCQRYRPRMAVLHEDPFCSRVCLEVSLGLSGA